MTHFEALQSRLSEKPVRFDARYRAKKFREKTVEMIRDRIAADERRADAEAERVLREQDDAFSRLLVSALDLEPAEPKPTSWLSKLLRSLRGEA